MKHLGKISLFVVGVFAVVYCLLLFLENNSQQETQETKQTTDSLIIWYNDTQLGQYLTAAAAEYKDRTGIQIKCKQVSSNGYVQNIADLSLSEDASAPDLYVLRQDMLESAYMAGVAAENTNEEFNENNFNKAALDSVTYHEKMIAYPLTFQIVCMAYRNDAVQPPESLESLFEIGVPLEGAEKFLDFNTDHFLSNYAFMGNAIEIGGSAGDLKEQFQINSEVLTQSLDAYKNFVYGLGIEKNLSEQAMIERFIQGKTLSVLLDSSYLKSLSEQARTAGVSWDLEKMPVINAALDTQTASYTNAVVVNGLSLKQNEAARFASFLTLDYAVGHLYKLSGQTPTYIEACQKDPMLLKAYTIYEQSQPLPKLLETEDFQMKFDAFMADLEQKDSMQAVNDFIQNAQSRFQEQ